MKTYKTLPEFVIDEDDSFELSSDELIESSDFWPYLKVGDKVTIEDLNLKDMECSYEFTGKVLGFNDDMQVGRIVYIEVNGHFVYYDAVTATAIIKLVETE